MRISRDDHHYLKSDLALLGRQLRCCIFFLLVVPFTVAATLPPQVSDSSTSLSAANGNSEPSSSSKSNADESADKHHSAKKSSDQTLSSDSSNHTLPNSPGSLRSQVIADNLHSDESPAPQQAPPETRHDPVGAAAAPVTKTTGIAAAQPAGAAFAPAKQKRARLVLVKVGLIVGAGVAVGTVAALAAASPSRPTR